jgi:hypothetical protein
LVDDEDNPMEPMSDIIYPVVNRFDKIQIINEDNPPYPNNDVVAAVSANFYWRDVLKKVLPDGKQGLIVVVENTPSLLDMPSTYFTYQVK